MGGSVDQSADEGRGRRQEFLKDIKALRRDLVESLSADDLEHLRRIERWGRASAAAGYLTAWVAPNPVSAGLLGLASSTRWLMMHHIAHRGYDKVPGVPERYTSRRFARGWRRATDWLDWIDPEAWALEHNTLHHAHTGEEADPDLLERNLEFLRTSTAPTWQRVVALGILAASWRLLYYAPSTLRVLQDQRDGVQGQGEHRAPKLADFFDLRVPRVRELWRRCLLPQGLARFVVIPALYLPLGPWAAFSVQVNTLMAEVVTNVHTFLVVAPNHTGDDLWRFDDPPQDQAEFFVRQVLGSANYRTGGDLNDFAHLWLNYQVEHHIWPALPMSAYQRAQPRLKALCEAHGVPYVQQSVWRRIGKMVDVCVGRSSMRRG